MNSFWMSIFRYSPGGISYGPHSEMRSQYPAAISIDWWSVKLTPGSTQGHHVRMKSVAGIQLIEPCSTCGHIPGPAWRARTTVSHVWVKRGIFGVDCAPKTRT